MTGHDDRGLPRNRDCVEDAADGPQFQVFTETFPQREMPADALPLAAIVNFRVIPRPGSAHSHPENIQFFRYLNDFATRAVR
ncbi:hypothetical protein ONR75_25340 [Rhodopseudomonas sp. P2A-2r]|uniref:hypothetical protein n=1 Tax=Rhodopseudomonas sp. P2A-2r TaxID=2991972 RepID=UPI0022343D28|nr:hypothetical protein [Rhodopseudomonas sp. P2A-2r]UZE48136.1 hypothetical protein ONR75_25340 [Rhodopseudomonas sp. P2A-2r]